MACRLVGTKPLSEPMLVRTLGTHFGQFLGEIYRFIQENVFKYFVYEM